MEVHIRSIVAMAQVATLLADTLNVLSKDSQFALGVFNVHLDMAVP